MGALPAAQRSLRLVGAMHSGSGPEGTLKAGEIWLAKPALQWVWGRGFSQAEAEAGFSLTGLGYSGANTVQLSLSVSSVTSTALHKKKHALNIHGNRGAHIQQYKSCHQMEKSLSGNMTGAPSVLQGREEQVAAPSEGRPKDSITPGRPATHMALGPAVINNQRHADRSLTRRTTLQSATGPPL